MKKRPMIGLGADSLVIDSKIIFEEIIKNRFISCIIFPLDLTLFAPIKVKW
jgi:hypothetical protein